MKLIDALLELLYPSRCAFCHRLLRDPADKVCARCRRELPYTDEAAREQSFPSVKRCVSPLYYENDVRQSLHRYKFSQRTGYAGIYADFVIKCIDECGLTCDYISWVPLSARRLRSRGCDQARLLAEAIAERLSVPCIGTLRKVRDTRPQSLTGGAEKRRENIRGAYRCTDEETVRGKTILLIDDIVTTGSTLSECARTLKNAGAAAVYAAAVARKRP